MGLGSQTFRRKCQVGKARESLWHWFRAQWSCEFWACPSGTISWGTWDTNRVWCHYARPGVFQAFGFDCGPWTPCHIQCSRKKKDCDRVFQIHHALLSCDRKKKKRIQHRRFERKPAKDNQTEQLLANYRDQPQTFLMSQRKFIRMKSLLVPAQVRQLIALVVTIGAGVGLVTGVNYYVPLVTLHVVPWIRLVAVRTNERGFNPSSGCREKDGSGWCSCN